MTDPQLVRASVQINYTADDGYRSECGFKSGKGAPDIGFGPTDPEAALLGGLEELARLTALFGFEDRALTVFNESRAAVAAWKESRR